MGTFNPVIPWRELERRLTWGRYGEAEQAAPEPASPPTPPRTAKVGPPYAELHAHSHFSFLDGASSPAELVAEAARLGLHGLAVTDHDGFAGAMQYKQAAEDAELATVFGAELSLESAAARTGVTDPAGSHLLVLARGAEGYRRLSAAIGKAQLAGKEKGKPVYDLEDLAKTATELDADCWTILTGCRKGTVRQALERHGLTEAGFEAAGVELRKLMDLFGPRGVVVELTDHDQPLDDARNRLLARLAARHGLPTVATGNVHYARPADYRLHTAMAALRARRTLAEMDGWLPGGAGAYLRSGAEMLARFPVHEFGDAVTRSADLAAGHAFDFDTVKPTLPDYPVPDGRTEASWLRELTYAGAAGRYGPESGNPKAYQQIAYELDVIEHLKFPGYFLIVYDIAEFCRTHGILAQGRGSAANSAVCFALGITSVDSVRHGLVFERFLSPVRDGPPDIDVDIEAGRREDVIQHVYAKYGRDRAAMVCNVITYRARLALRDSARVLGYSPGTVDAWAGSIGPHEGIPDGSQDVPEQVLELAGQLQRRPRHLGIHNGGMVIVDRPLAQVVPIEWARREGRTVLQWDKDDCAAAGLVKFDLLGLGMLGAIHDALDLIAEHHGTRLGLHDLPQDGDPEADAVYEMIQDADTVGVFQIESRAQMSTLPRLKPRTFYDLVVEVALIRPGPIQGGAVHPYLRRRNGDEEVTYPHPTLEPVLRRTMGVVLFQEQAMQMAIAAAGFSASEADRLRQAMGSKRSPERMAELKERLMAGMAEHGITPEVAEDIYIKLHAFSGYGFPESHSVSMAYIVWCSCYLKRYYPAAFTAALLNNQPMGFYSPGSLVTDVRRHGVQVKRVDVNASEAKAVLQSPDKPYRPRHRHASPLDQPAIRQGLSSVRDLGEEAAQKVVAERQAGGPFADVEDFIVRTGLSRSTLEALATAGAFGCFGLDRREALWTAGALAGTTAGHLPGTAPGTTVPELDPLTPVEVTLADLWATGTSPEDHPIGHLRARLALRGVVPAAELRTARNRSLVRIAGLVTHRQRPPTAHGTCFLGLEDETGLINVICPAPVWEAQRRVALEHGALLIHGTLERTDGAVNVVAGRIEALRVGVSRKARDFR
ncbi:error-prone DNA polymerase [Catenulispora sp. NL8]|uniref:Error-prone DNA polymerase n=1 Tax=Catenulispora pinistramenti TaxID=2705254 RepID=A0ABS5KV46_9ACTN|nr:error-prone DNA polymerase [Catenulispora pinistramenti]MBS2549920.1 error-prone DNA polymerase [Catenulispora pinistramenti]